MDNGNDSQNAWLGPCCDGINNLKRLFQHKTRCPVLGIPYETQWSAWGRDIGARDEI